MRFILKRRIYAIHHIIQSFIFLWIGWMNEFIHVLVWCTWYRKRNIPLFSFGIKMEIHNLYKWYAKNNNQIIHRTFFRRRLLPLSDHNNLSNQYIPQTVGQYHWIITFTSNRLWFCSSNAAIEYIRYHWSTFNVDIICTFKL